MFTNKTLVLIDLGLAKYSGLEEQAFLFSLEKYFLLINFANNKF